jgi:hypothetical protein
MSTPSSAAGARTSANGSALDLDPQLLGQLAPQAGERGLAGLGFAAGQVEDVGRRALADQQQPARAEHGGGDDPEHASGIPLAVDDWRDLGGIRTADGRTIRPGALVRARRYAPACSAITRESWPPCQASGDFPGSSVTSRAPGMADA